MYRFLTTVTPQDHKLLESIDAIINELDKAIDKKASEIERIQTEGRIVEKRLAKDGYVSFDETLPSEGLPEKRVEILEEKRDKLQDAKRFLALSKIKINNKVPLTAEQNDDFIRLGVELKKWVNEATNPSWKGKIADIIKRIFIRLLPDLIPPRSTKCIVTETSNMHRLFEGSNVGINNSANLTAPRLLLRG